MFRNILSAVAALVAGMVVIMLVCLVGHAMYPPPPDLDYDKPESVKAYMNTVPLGALLVVLLAHALGALTGGLVAAFIAVTNQLRLALLAGVLTMAVGIMQLFKIPSPLWFTVVDLILFVPAAYIGYKIWKLTKGAAL